MEHIFINDKNEVFGLILNEFDIKNYSKNFIYEKNIFLFKLYKRISNIEWNKLEKLSKNEINNILNNN
jgi:hypothetical protein